MQQPGVTLSGDTSQIRWFDKKIEMQFLGDIPCRPNGGPPAVRPTALESHSDLAIGL